MGKGLSGQLPYLVQPGAQVLNVGGVDAPGLVRPFCILVQVGAAPLEQDNRLAHIRQVQLHTDTVQSHLADIGTHVQDAGLLHLGADAFLIFGGRYAPSVLPLSSSALRLLSGLFVRGYLRRPFFQVLQNRGPLALADFLTDLRLVLEDALVHAEGGGLLAPQVLQLLLSPFQPSGDTGKGIVQPSQVAPGVRTQADTMAHLALQGDLELLLKGVVGYEKLYIMQS